MNQQLHQKISALDGEKVKLKTQFDQEENQKREMLLPLIEDKKQEIIDEEERLAQGEIQIEKTMKENA